MRRFIQFLLNATEFHWFSLRSWFYHCSTTPTVGDTLRRPWKNNYLYKSNKKSVISDELFFCSDIHGCYYLLSFRTIVVVSPLQPWPCVTCTSRCKGGLWQCDSRYIPLYTYTVWGDDLIIQTNIKKPWVVHLGSSWFILVHLGSSWFILVHLGSSWFIFRNWTGIFYRLSNNWWFILCTTFFQFLKMPRNDQQVQLYILCMYA